MVVVLLQEVEGVLLSILEGLPAAVGGHPLVEEGHQMAAEVLLLVEVGR